MNRTRIGILFGGCSEEHDVSVKSAREVARNLDPVRYDAYWIGISKQGAWTLCAGPDGNWHDAAPRPVVLPPDPTVHGLLVLDGGRYTPVFLDVVLPVLHGTHGEDGAIQGLLELSGIPYIGCDVQSSALCMDKSLAYVVAAAAGIATPDHLLVGPGEVVDPTGLSFPAFVKPARSGSSFGVTKVSAPDELADAVRTAREFDSKVLVEQAVVGAEIGCAVLSERFGLVTGEVDRVALSSGFFRIHQEDDPENGSANSTFVVPADITPQQRTLVQDTARAVYRALGCSGLARVDLFLRADGSVVLNEVNTLPGLTSYSRYPRMMAAAGITMNDLVDRLVARALHGTRR